MNLNFSTHIHGKPTYFVEKILQCLFSWRVIPLADEAHCREQYFRYFKKSLSDTLPYAQKIHTIRTDNANRWEKGKNIHFYIHARTKDAYQFAPVIPVESVQAIKIVPVLKGGTVHIDNRKLTNAEIEILARNDGFADAQAFWSYFIDELDGKIIHWTKHRYEADEK